MSHIPGRGERGQAALEVLWATPLIAAAAFGLVETGAAVSDRVAVEHGAAAAAVAHLRGEDELRAAKAALPHRLRAGASVQVDHDSVVLTVSPRGARRLLGRAFSPTATLHLPGEVPS